MGVGLAVIKWKLSAIVGPIPKGLLESKRVLRFAVQGKNILTFIYILLLLYYCITSIASVACEIFIYEKYFMKQLKDGCLLNSL